GAITSTHRLSEPLLRSRQVRPSQTSRGFWSDRQNPNQAKVSCHGCSNSILVPAQMGFKRSNLHRRSPCFDCLRAGRPTKLGKRLLLHFERTKRLRNRPVATDPLVKFRSNLLPSL